MVALWYRMVARCVGLDDQDIGATRRIFFMNDSADYDPVNAEPY
jgi:hypothetical protein